MAKEKLRMPSSGGGLVRYYDEEYKSRFILNPQVVIGLSVAIIVILIVLSAYFG